jgi:ADP-ribosyl-[dinitrogen reductase] hydrolase
VPNSKSVPSAAELACPHCGETVRPVPLVFGYPTDETFEQAGRGEVALGGCVVSGDDPDWACPICGGGIWNVNGPTLDERLAGAVWGHLVGDAVGVPYEFGPPMEPHEVRFGASGTHGQPPGTWSDDGALMLALLDSLVESGFDTTDQAQRALAWFRDGHYTPDSDGRFDWGGATGAAMDSIARGVPAEEAGPTHERAGGNGSLMRILPLALVGREWSDEELVERAHRASRVTHGHPRPQVACALYVLVARGLLEGRLGRMLVMGEALLTLRGLYYVREPQYLEALRHLEGWPERQGRGSAWDAFWSAWDAFAEADSYEEAIRRAVSYGNDTDTTAAIAGGLAGIHWGIGGIPAEWLAGMRGRAIVEPLLRRLIAAASA